MKKIFIKFFAFILAFAVIAAPVQLSFAAAPPEGAQVSDMYSAWAAEDVLIAQSVYDLGNEGTYSNFRGELSSQKFSAVFQDLSAIYQTGYELVHQDARLTRGQLITILYGVMFGGEPAEAEAAAFFADNGLINGRKSGDYQLDAVCTVEEMIALAVRVYDFGVYGEGDFTIGFLWEAEGLSNTVYLLGSIHLADASLYPLSKGAELAFMRSANLVVEADILGMDEQDAAYIMSKALLDPSGDETIADFISEETYELYVVISEALGLTQDFYDYIRPWMAYNMLNAMLMTGGDEETVEEYAAQGIDMYFLMKAVDTGKNIQQLESVTFQIDILSSASPELQELMLYETLLMAAGLGDGDEPEDGEKQDAGEKPGAGEKPDAGEAADHAGLLAYMTETFKSGNAEALNELLSGMDEADENPLIAEFKETLITLRDAAMAEKIAGYLQETEFNGNYFVVVGALHLVNDNSVVTQLRDMGYTLERILK